MEPLRKIPKVFVQDYCQENNLKNFNVSAKTGEGLERLFTLISEQIIIQNAKQ